MTGTHSHFVWALALSILSTACAATGAVPRPFPTPRPAGAVQRNPAGSAAVDSLLTTALELTGAPYLDGGSDPSGFDCSGFTQYVFARNGLALPRQVRDQFRLGAQVGRGDLRPGDLVFFTTTAPGASHVAIALGNHQFVHAPSSTGTVRVERLDAHYWTRRFVGARRIQQE